MEAVYISAVAWHLHVQASIAEVFEKKKQLEASSVSKAKPSVTKPMPLPTAFLETPALFSAGVKPAKENKFKPSAKCVPLCTYAPYVCAAVNLTKPVRQGLAQPHVCRIGRAANKTLLAGGGRRASRHYMFAASKAFEYCAVCLTVKRHVVLHTELVCAKRWQHKHWDSVWPCTSHA